MNKIAVLLRRAIILWCLVGFGKLVLFVRPYIMAISHDVLTDWETNPVLTEVTTWFILALCVGALVALLAAVHYFAKWLFNEGRHD